MMVTILGMRGRVTSESFGILSSGVSISFFHSLSPSTCTELTGLDLGRYNN